LLTLNTSYCWLRAIALAFAPLIPVCASLRMLRDFLLIAQPPLGEEGKFANLGIWATRPSVRGYNLSPLCGSNRMRFARHRGQQRVYNRASYAITAGSSC
jgi:hypothetical protein